MALSILDGNQSATTLSTILTSGQHITAHTVVSLGTQAITDISGAVSGSVVSISNFPATQPVSIASVTVGNSVTIGSLPAISGTVTVGNSVTIGSLPAISGTVTANISSAVFSNPSGEGATPNEAVAIGWVEEIESGANFNYVSKNNPLPISGTVTIGSALPTGTNRIGVVTIGAGTVTLGAGTAQIGSVTASISGTVPVSISSVTVGNSVTIGSLPAISGTVTANGIQTQIEDALFSTDNLVNNINNFLSPVNPLPISGTVTANSSNGSLTTRFGSVTTANTAFQTSAVTNSARKYLLIQNITTASNVITVGIGFTPTTTQGIQLFAGAGIAFEGNFIPTGSVNLLSSVTASCFTILEA